MATKVQSSVMDLNNGSRNGMWDPYHDDRSPGYNSFLMSQPMGGHSGYPKEQMRLTILKQESIFRQQLQELHRLYKRQKDLMNEFTANGHYKFGAANSSHLLSHVSSHISKDMHTQRRVIDLELPADVDEDNEGNQAVKVVQNLSKKRGYNLADLNEPIHMEEASFTPSVNSDYRVTDKLQKQDSSTHSKLWYLQGEPKKAHEHLSRNRTIFGVELSESSCKPSFDSSKSSWDQNASSVNHTRVPIVNVQDSANRSHDKNAENDKNKLVLESRLDFDLNLSFDEEEEEDPSSAPNIPEAVVKIASMEIDLETPAALEAEPDDVCMDADDQELVKTAAEAIISISSSEVPPADTLLWWLAEVIASGDDLKDSVKVNKDEDSIPEGMDYFEYMTLKLQETKEEFQCYEAVTVAEKEEEDSSSRKRAARKGQGKRGRPRKDFQRDVLPGIVSLSRREVTEDLQIFEEAFNGIGVSWQSKRKTGGKNGRGRRRLVAPSPPSSPPPPIAAVPVEKSVCWEVALDKKGLSGWGKRTRRLPRQRCQNGGNHQSLALKC
ncbi:hypothetical protein M8C21_000883 [Ambrosia artemisiifolia]|uniref:Uncharacterized protein n=1 Tax=Ambrosia artemisiifolia TaxID=4212 RepID=A0AAD5CG44_AMBAR|nr:hypothetical protein M8C21_000883 [Ambrosia artemisiifolia]